MYRVHFIVLDVRIFLKKYIGINEMSKYGCDLRNTDPVIYIFFKNNSESNKKYLFKLSNLIGMASFVNMKF